LHLEQALTMGARKEILGSLSLPRPLASIKRAAAFYKVVGQKVNLIDLEKAQNLTLVSFLKNSDVLRQLVRLRAKHQGPTARPWSNKLFRYCQNALSFIKFCGFTLAFFAMAISFAICGALASFIGRSKIFCVPFLNVPLALGPESRQQNYLEYLLARKTNKRSSPLQLGERFFTALLWNLPQTV